METSRPASRDADVQAIFERLQAEVRAQPAPDQAPADAASDWRAERDEAERRWPVSAERPFENPPGRAGRVRGIVLAPVKATLRRLMRWYVEPFAADQRAFNAAALRLLDQLAERVDAAVVRLEATTEELRSVARRGAEHDDRIARLERRPAAADAAPATAPATTDDAPDASPPALPDYFAFEVRMRGTTDDVRDRQRRYVDDFRAAGPVLDVGCGRGEFLGLLRDAGVVARGVDSDADMVAFARGEGHEVAHEDAFRQLEGTADGSLGGIFAAQFVEHLAPGRLVRFLTLAAAKLRPGGVLVLETINPASLVALRHYFADLTHVQPLVADTLAQLVRQVGFADAEIRYLNEPDESERLRPVALPPEPAFDAARAALDADVARLNEVVFGAQDYAVVARR